MYGQLDMLLNLSYYTQNCDGIIYLTLEGEHLSTENEFSLQGHATYIVELN